MYSIRSRHLAILAGAALLLGTLACSTGAAQPTPTLFVLPTLLSTTAPAEPTIASAVVEEATNAEAMPAESSAPSVTLDVCALYTQAELEALYGETVSVIDNNTTSQMPDGNEAHLCTYVTPTGYYVTITVVVYESTETLAKSWQDSQAQMPPDMVMLDGLGDEAIYWPAAIFGSMLTARQGVYTVSAMLVDGGNGQGTIAPPTDNEIKLQRAQTIVQTALSRLPQ